MMARLFPGWTYALTLAMAVTSVHAGDGDVRNRTNYLLHCSGCHQADGSGRPENGIPRMKDEVGHFLRIPEGRAFLVQVPGTSQSSMTDADTAAMLNWLVVAMSREQMPADFVPYTVDEVARLRAQPLSDAAGTRRHVVDMLRARGFRLD
jgi:mono/diheme cytochrome c family protein